jgi:hypothetical protein
VDAYDAKQNHYYSKEKYEIFETVMEGKLLWLMYVGSLEEPVWVL